MKRVVLMHGKNHTMLIWFIWQESPLFQWVLYQKSLQILKNFLFSFLEVCASFSDIYIIPMQNGNKYQLILIIGFIFLLLEWRVGVNIIFFLGKGEILQNFGFQNELIYNKLLKTHGTGDLEILEISPLFPYEADRTELIGDVSFVRGDATGDILMWYERSLAIEDRPRVREKISLLSVPWWWADNVSLSTIGSGEVYSGSTGQNMSAVDQSLHRISEDTQKRGQFIQKTSDSHVLDDTRAFFDLGEERVDW